MDKDKGQSKNSLSSNTKLPFVFSNDPYVSYSSKKTEKIIKAIYLITNFFDVREPLKWSMREVSLMLLQKISSLNISSLADREKFVLDICGKANELLVLVDTAHRAGFISSMNAEILIREIKTLAAFVQEKHQEYYSTAALLQFNQPFFFVEDPLIPKNSPKNIVKKEPKGHTPLKDKGDVLNDINQGKVSFTVPDLNIKSNSENINIKGRDNEDKKNRRNEILEIAKNLGNFSIKDVSNRIINCSEKTIQRELVEMVNEGILLKSGERRWSRYSLVVGS